MQEDEGVNQRANVTLDGNFSVPHVIQVIFTCLNLEPIDLREAQFNAMV